MLTATRREWNELYVFFNLLAQGGIVLGNEEGLPSGRVLPIFQVTRQEHDGERRYTVEETDIHVEGEQMDERFPREDFGTVAAMILDTLKRERNEEVEAPEGVEGFLDALKIYDMEARTDDRTDFYITFHDSSFPPVGNSSREVSVSPNRRSTKSIIRTTRTIRTRWHAACFTSRVWAAC